MTPAPTRDYYSILGVSKTADECALKKAYRRLAIKFHPDKHANGTETQKHEAEKKFKEVSVAFECLSDPNKRAIYDQYGEDGLKAGGGGVPGGFRSGGFGPDSASFNTSSSGVQMDAEQMEKIFQSVFGKSRMGSMGGIGGSIEGGMSGSSMGGGMGSGQGMDGLPSSLAQMFGSMAGMDVMGGTCGMGGTKRRRSASNPPGMLPSGTSVKLVALSNAAYNGATGSIDTFDQGRGRYLVTLHGRDTTIAAAPGNVSQVVSKAKVVATSRAELNGQAIDAVTYDNATKRYQVKGLSSDGSILALKPENIRLPKHVHVVVEGVQSRPALNGRKGQIVDVDEERYLVSIPGEAPMRLRFGNVVAY